MTSSFFFKEGAASCFGSSLGASGAGAAGAAGAAAAAPSNPGGRLGCAAGVSSDFFSLSPSFLGWAAGASTLTVEEGSAAAAGAAAGSAAAGAVPGRFSFIVDDAGSAFGAAAAAEASSRLGAAAPTRGLGIATTVAVRFGFCCIGAASGWGADADADDAPGEASLILGIAEAVELRFGLGGIGAAASCEAGAAVGSGAGAAGSGATGGGTCIVDDGSAFGVIFSFGMDAAVALRLGFGGIGAAAEASGAAGGGTCIVEDGSLGVAIFNFGMAGAAASGAAGAGAGSAAGGGTCIVDDGSTFGVIFSFGIAAAVALRLGLGGIGAASDAAGAGAAGAGAASAAGGVPTFNGAGCAVDASGMLRCAPSVVETCVRGVVLTTFIRIVSRLFCAPGAMAEALPSRSEMRRRRPVAVSRRLMGSAIVCVAPGSAPIGAAGTAPVDAFPLFSTLKRLVSVFFANFSFGVGFSFSLIAVLPYLEYCHYTSISRAKHII